MNHINFLSMKNICKRRRGLSYGVIHEEREIKSIENEEFVVEIVC